MVADCQNHPLLFYADVCSANEEFANGMYCCVEKVQDSAVMHYFEETIRMYDDDYFHWEKIGEAVWQLLYGTISCDAYVIENSNGFAESICSMQYETLWDAISAGFRHFCAVNCISLEKPLSATQIMRLKKAKIKCIYDAKHKICTLLHRRIGLSIVCSAVEKEGFIYCVKDEEVRETRLYEYK